MKIQQHDGVVVDAGRHSSRASPSTGRGRCVTGGRGRGQGLGCGCPRSPTIYRVPRRGGGAPALGDPISKGGGQGGGLPPKPSGAPPTPRVSNPRRRGGPRGAHQPTRGWFPSHFSPWGPPG